MGHEHRVFEEVENYLKYVKSVVQYASVVLAAFIIFLSLKYVKCSLIRTYTLNICIAGLICSLYKVTREHINPFVDPLLPDSNKLGNLIDSLVHVAILFPALVLHEVQGTLLIAITYLSFSQPLKYRHIFSRRNVWIGFIAGNAVSFLLALAMYIEEVSTLHGLQTFRTHDIFRFAVEGCLITVMFTFYFKTLYVLAVKKEDPRSPLSSTDKRNHASLKAVIIYCTPPNVFLVLGIAASACSMVDTLQLTQITETTRLAHGQSNILMYLAKNTIMIRLFVSLVCALTTFPQYRQALKRFLFSLVQPARVHTPPAVRLFSRADAPSEERRKS